MAVQGEERASEREMLSVYCERWLLYWVHWGMLFGVYGIWNTRSTYKRAYIEAKRTQPSSQTSQHQSAPVTRAYTSIGANIAILYYLEHIV